MGSLTTFPSLDPLNPLRAALGADVRPPLTDTPDVGDPWSAMPDWAVRLMADTVPEKAADVVARACKRRGYPYPDEEAARLTIATTSAWLRGGSRLVRLTDPLVATSLLALGDTPRFHALTTPEPGPVYMVKGAGGALIEALYQTTENTTALSRFLRSQSDADDVRETVETLTSNALDYAHRIAYAGQRCLEKGVLIFDSVLSVMPGPQGPLICVWMPTDEGSGREWVINLDRTGAWEILRWHAFSQEVEAQDTGPGGPGDLAAVAVLITMAVNAVAAIVEAREVVRVKRPRGPSKGSRGARQRRKAVRPQVYTLDPHALSSWTMRVEREETADVHRRSRSSSDGTRTVRLHTCREHQRRTWVVSPEPGEVVVDTRLGKVRKDGSRATLHCVLRTIQEHARGTGVSPRSVVLRCGA